MRDPHARDMRRPGPSADDVAAAIFAEWPKDMPSPERIIVQRAGEKLFAVKVEEFGGTYESFFVALDAYQSPEHASDIPPRPVPDGEEEPRGPGRD